MNNAPHLPKKRFFASPVGLFCLALSAVVCALLSLRFGSVWMPDEDFWSALIGKGTETDRVILYSMRLPRALGSLLAGAALAGSGVLLQSVTGQALASPNIIGINAGAGVGVVLGMSVLEPILVTLGVPFASFSGNFFTVLVPFCAFLGALSAALLVSFVTVRAGGGRSATVLSGVAVTALLNAVISTMTLLDPDLLVSYNSFSVGGFAGLSYRALPVPVLLILFSVAAVLLLGRRIDLLSLGSSMAGVMGVNVKALRLLCLMAASLMAASAVSFAGLLGFVGLVVPHMARKLVGNRTRPLFLASLFLGAAVTTLADLLGRICVSPGEIPVGITMALVGAPFFLYLLLRERGREL